MTPLETRRLPVLLDTAGNNLVFLARDRLPVRELEPVLPEPRLLEARWFLLKPRAVLRGTRPSELGLVQLVVQVARLLNRLQRQRLKVS
jgi:hypothetical protein